VKIYPAAGNFLNRSGKLPTISAKRTILLKLHATSSSFLSSLRRLVEQNFLFFNSLLEPDFL
jgi:hypothetical protein